MKKLTAILLVMILAFSLCMTASAAPNNFISSPPSDPGPELSEGENESETCPAEIIIVPFSQRHLLPDDLRAKIEEAYDILCKTVDFSKLNPKVKAIAQRMGLKMSQLAVSDLFDIRYEGCEDHENHGAFRITLKDDSLKNFVCLLHYYNDEWRVIENATVINGTDLKFTEKEFSPFAILVYTEAEAPQPGTGGSSHLPLYIGLMVVSALAIVLVWRKSRKQVTE